MCGSIPLRGATRYLARSPSPDPMPLDFPIARTAFYCTALRADDAAAPHPVCNDHLAARFVTPEIRQLMAPALAHPGPAASNVARHRIIDDLLRAALAADPTRRILLQGAGFDTRAFRLPGGRWVEVDDPGLLAYKEARLPAAEAPNPLTRIAIDFATESVRERLAPLAGDDPVLIVLEGVLMYLPDEVIVELGRTFLALFPNHQLLADVQSPKFRRRYAGPIALELEKLGAHFADRHEPPGTLLARAGYRRVAATSIIGAAVDHGSLKFPRWLLATLLRELRDGYAIWQLARAG